MSTSEATVAGKEPQNRDGQSDPSGKGGPSRFVSRGFSVAALSRRCHQAGRTTGPREGGQSRFASSSAEVWRCHVVEMSRERV
jgi:hypothetical protein